MQVVDFVSKGKTALLPLRADYGQEPIHQHLLNWYKKSRRDLPWRCTREPYHIWVSEIMLQQTQVKTVLGRYQDWFRLFPTIESLAAASMDEVLKAWEGLGYYRRARFMHQAAVKIISEHGGNFPTGFDEIVNLPGIGRSTAGAIASICFGLNSPVLDGNVKRVLKRWSGNNELRERELWDLAQQVLDDSNEPADWNQAMMELGATLCSAGSPNCGACPVNRACLSAFQVEAVKRVQKRKPFVDVHWRVHLITCPERGIWLARRPDSGIWGGLWSPPISELGGQPEDEPAYIHQLTHRRLHLYPEMNESEPNSEGCWVSAPESYAMPTGIQRLLEKVMPG